MTGIWVDAQLSPSLAAWISRSYEDLEAKSVRSLGLREAEDEEIFRAARKSGAIIMSKDRDFLNLLERYGPPPKVIWITSGNTSNKRMRQVLERTLLTAIDLLNTDEVLVEIGDIAT